MRDRLAAFVKGHYHMWFLWMITGIYVCMPLIKLIIKTDFGIKYYLLLSFLFAFVIPEILTLMNDFGNEIVIHGANVIQGNIDNMHMDFVLGYVSYFVLGYVLDKIDLNKYQRLLIYVLGIFGCVFTVVADLIVALKTQKGCSNYYGNFKINILFEAIAVFTWFRYRTYDKRGWNSFFQKLSKYSFGAYIIHVLIIGSLNAFLGWNTLSFYSLNPALAVMILSLIVFLLSFAASAILNKIPIVKKYVV